MTSPDQIRELKEHQAEEEALLRQVQDEQREAQASSQGLVVTLEHLKNKPRVDAFFRDLMAYAGKITQSIKPDGTLTRKFVMVGPAIDPQNRPWVCLSCFNYGFATFEFGLVSIKAQLLAAQYG